MGKTGQWFSRVSLGQSLMECLFQHRELGLLPRVCSGTREVAFLTASRGSDAAVSGSTLGEELSPGNEAGVRDVGQGTASVSHSHYWQ